jgi:hypothetical protein
MNPIGVYYGPERRKVDRNRLIVFWAILAIATVISTGSLLVANQATKTANRASSAQRKASNAQRIAQEAQSIAADRAQHAEAAHCVLVKFLAGSNARNRASIEKNPADPGNAQRRDAVKQTAELIRELRLTGINCGH